jgi:hypothetical protein
LNILAPLPGGDVQAVAALGSDASQRELVAMIEDALSLRSQAIHAAEDVLMHRADAKDAPRFGQSPTEFNQWALEAEIKYDAAVSAYNALVRKIGLKIGLERLANDVFSGMRGEA